MSARTVMMCVGTVSARSLTALWSSDTLYRAASLNGVMMKVVTVCIHEFSVCLPLGSRIAYGLSSVSVLAT